MVVWYLASREQPEPVLLLAKFLVTHFPSLARGSQTNRKYLFSRLIVGNFLQLTRIIALLVNLVPKMK